VCGGWDKRANGMFTKTFLTAPSFLHRDHQPDNVRIIRGSIYVFCNTHLKTDWIEIQRRDLMIGTIVMRLVAVYAENIPLGILYGHNIM